MLSNGGEGEPNTEMLGSQDDT